MRRFVAAMFFLLSFTIALGEKSGLCEALTVSAEQLAKPMLRIEPGAHTGMISDVDTDTAGRTAVTASLDKTARLYDIASGRLLRTFRPPIGEKSEGALFAVALSPDGRTVATGGWTSLGGGFGASVYLFDAANGQLLRRLELEGEGGIQCLVFSPDGRHLAVRGGTKLQIFRLADGVKVAADTWTQSGSASFASVHFAADGRLVAISSDGFVRLYGRTFLLSQKFMAPGGSKASIVRFSPDGSRIAVGYSGSSRVDILSGENLIPLFAVDDGMDKRSENEKVLAWSSDSRTLFVQGEASKVRRWRDGGRGKVEDVYLGLPSSFTDIAPLPGGNLLFATNDLYLGILADNGNVRLLARPAINNNVGNSTNKKNFQISTDGSTVHFTYDFDGKSKAFFNTATRELRPDSGEKVVVNKFNGAQLKQPSAVTDVAPDGESYILVKEFNLSCFAKDGRELWRGSNVIAHGGVMGAKYVSNRAVVTAYGDGTIRWHRISDGEEYLALFPHVDGKRWILWTPSGYYDASPGGEELIGWHVNNMVMDRSESMSGAYVNNVLPNSPAAKAGLMEGDIITEVNGVKISIGEDVPRVVQNSKMGKLIAIKLIRRNSGTLILEVNPLRENEQTPPRIGVSLGKSNSLVSAQSADFFPASRFRGTFYRPDIVDRILNTLNEPTAIAQANAASGRRESAAVAQVLPPVATILGPTDGEMVRITEFSLRYSVRSPAGAPVISVKVLVDGRPISQNRGIDLKQIPAVAGEEVIAVTIPPRDCEVTLIAENANAASVPATIRLKWGGQTQKNEEFTIQPKLYVLVVGVSDYANSTLKLSLAAKDARDFAAAMQKQKGGLYRDVVTKILTDKEATRDNVVDGLDWLVKETTSKDVAILYLAGHGVNDPSGIYYYLPQNADLDKLRRTGVPFSDIRNTVASLAGKTIFFVDTCHSGNVMGNRRGTTDINAVVNELSSAENGAVVFASSTGRQYSLEKAEWGNGAFTKALVEGLNGKADYTGKGTISINMLDLYLSERVKELTGGQQTPTTSKPQMIQDFPIALKR